MKQQLSFVSRLSQPILALYFICLAQPLKCQLKYFGENPVVWKDNKPPVLPNDLNLYVKSDLVILDDKAEIIFMGDHSVITRNALLKINTAKGLEEISRLSLPESFDRAYDGVRGIGQDQRFPAPYIPVYTINQLGARKFSSLRWLAVPFEYKYESVSWPLNNGKYKSKDICRFNFKNLKVGDIVEIHYTSDFTTPYGPNLFYFNATYPKLNCEYVFAYPVYKKHAGYNFIFPVNIKDSAIEKVAVNHKDFVAIGEKISLHHLGGINFPSHNFEGRELPHVSVDFSFFKIITNSYPNGDGTRIYDYDYIRPKNFEWMAIKDTNVYSKIYDKQFTAIRKFLSSFPPTGSDSSNLVFTKVLCDTFNNFRYISPAQLFYQESDLANLYSGDHLLKRRLTGPSLLKVYRDIFNERNILYYTANIEDRRLGEHNVDYRAHFPYEIQLFAIPDKNGFGYFMPRYQGVKYHFNELPFYLEGSLVSLLPENLPEEKGDQVEKQLKFTRTHQTTFNENTRTENGTARITLDSLITRLVIKESLTGQFSTVLRHLYLNELIDSTISLYYFKKCSEKPGALDVKIKLSSHIEDFPFRYTFNCSEKLPLQTKGSLDLAGWFSFPISKNAFPEAPTHNYYFDFDYTDSYNFLLDFTTAVEIKNSSGFEKKIDNDFFGLESEIVKNSESNYLLKVKLQVKKKMIPVDRSALITEMVDALEELNGFSLVLEKK